MFCNGREMISDWFDSPFVSHVDIGSHQLHSTADHLVNFGLLCTISRVSLKREGFPFNETKQCPKKCKIPRIDSRALFGRLIACGGVSVSY